MVDHLVQRGDIREPRVERAFRTVRRHWFLPDTPLDDVYCDRAVVTHRGPDGVPVSSSSQPATMARMLEQLRVEPGLAVLEIGTGTGFNAALLSHLVAPNGTVVTVDVDPAIAAAATQHLIRAEAPNVSVVAGDGWARLVGASLFDRIETTVGVWDLSPTWVDRLRRGGVLVAPVWLRAGLQASVAFQKIDGKLESISVEPCAFMRMRGPGAGQPTYQQLGSWTVSLDRPDAETARVVATLLETEPRTEPAPALDPGWFTPIALSEAGALHLFSLGSKGPVTRAGILDSCAPGLAVVESHPGANPPAVQTIRAFGSGSHQPLRRLLDLIHHSAPIDLRQLAVSAIPAGQPVDDRGALATLTRPNFTLVIGAPR